MLIPGILKLNFKIIQFLTEKYWRISNKTIQKTIWRVTELINTFEHLKQFWKKNSARMKKREDNSFSQSLFGKIEDGLVMFINIES